MILVLVAEIVSALVALALVIALLVQLARSVRAKSPAIASDESRVRHRMLSAILLVAVIVHGASATIYASGAHPLSYALAGIGAAAGLRPLHGPGDPIATGARLHLAQRLLRRGRRAHRRPRRRRPSVAEISSLPKRARAPRSRQRRFQKKGPESVEIPVLRGQEPRYSPWRFAKRLLRV